jgi:hypothetical protein
MIAADPTLDLRLLPKEGAVEAMLPGDDPMAGHLSGLMPVGSRPADFIASLIISARKV